MPTLRRLRSVRVMVDMAASCEAIGTLVARSGLTLERLKMFRGREAVEFRQIVPGDDPWSRWVTLDPQLSRTETRTSFAAGNEYVSAPSPIASSGYRPRRSGLAMLARGCARCAGRARVGPLSRPRIPPAARSQCRRYSSQAGTPTTLSHGNAVGSLAPFVSELDRIAPSFDIRGDQIEVIQTPAEFYETLKVHATSPSPQPVEGNIERLDNWLTMSRTAYEMPSAASSSRHST